MHKKGDTMKTKQMVLMSLNAALLTASAWIAVPLPFSMVPLSLQSFWIIFMALVFPLKTAMGSVGLYILLGCIGLPVFAKGQSGLSVLFGPSGGYLIGFIFAISMIYYVRTRWTNLQGYTVAAFLGGIGIVYLFGVTWLAFILNMTHLQAFMVGAIPFMAGDMIKVMLAAYLAYRMKSLSLRLHQTLS